MKEKRDSQGQNLIAERYPNKLLLRLDGQDNFLFFLALDESDRLSDNAVKDETYAPSA